MRRSGHRDEQGFAAMWTAVIVVAIIAFAGVVIDAGYALNAKQQANRTAEQAARLGADQINTDSLYSGHGQVEVDPAEAEQAAQTYLQQQGVSGRVQISGDTVTVTVDDYQRSSILGAVGINGFPIEGTASARTFDGAPVVVP